MSASNKAPALEIAQLHTWYGESHILHDVNLKVEQGEVVTLLGRNGAGRTTTLRAIMGLTGARTGSIKVHGVEAIGLATHKIAHLGIGYCPEERGIFSSLSTEENLMLPPRLAWPQSPSVWRSDGARKPVETPPLTVQRGFRFHTPYRRGLTWLPNTSWLS